jgi:hypothetical protein
MWPCWVHCSGPGWQWSDSLHGKAELLEDVYPSDIPSIKNAIWNTLGMNPGFHIEKPTSDLVSDCIPIQFIFRLIAAGIWLRNQFCSGNGKGSFKYDVGVVNYVFIHFSWSLCGGPISRSEASYRLWCVWSRDLKSKAVLAHLRLLRQRAIHCLWIGMLLPGSSLTKLIVTTKQFFFYNHQFHQDGNFWNTVNSNFQPACWSTNEVFGILSASFVGNDILSNCRNFVLCSREPNQIRILWSQFYCPFLISAPEKGNDIAFKKTKTFSVTVRRGVLCSCEHQCGCAELNLMEC